MLKSAVANFYPKIHRKVYREPFSRNSSGLWQWPANCGSGRCASLLSHAACPRTDTRLAHSTFNVPLRWIVILVWRRKCHRDIWHTLHAVYAIGDNQSINLDQSLFKIRQPESIVTRPKQLEKNTHTTQCRIYNTDRREKRETKPLLEPDICCRRSHQYFSAISSNRGKANSFSIKVTL